MSIRKYGQPGGAHDNCHTLIYVSKTAWLTLGSSVYQRPFSGPPLPIPFSPLFIPHLPKRLYDVWFPDMLFQPPTTARTQSPTVMAPVADLPFSYYQEFSSFSLVTASHPRLCTQLWRAACKSMFVLTGKAIPLQAWRGPGGFREVEALRFQDNRYRKVVRSALRTGRLYPPGSIPGTHFC